VVSIKKVSIILLTISIFFTSLILPIKNASAVTFTPSTMAIATKVIRGIGERLGVNWSKGALDAVVGYIAGQSGTEGHEPILPFWWLFGTTPDTIPIDADKSLVRLTPDDFRDGTKEIKKAIDAVIPDTIIPIFGRCNDKFYNTYNNMITVEPTHYFYWHDNEKNLDYLTVYDNPLGSTVIKDVAYNVQNLGHWIAYERVPGVVAWTETATGLNTNSIIFMGHPPVDLLYNNADSRSCDYSVTNNDVTNISNVNNNYWNTTTNNYNYYTDYDVTINNIGDGTENVDVPVNPPFTPEEGGHITDPPPPPDTDNDGVPDSTDITPGGETPTPDDTGIFAKLFPVLLIVKLFGVLGSCLMYLVRMFQFIMTIPGIDAIPIDNDAFVWFRSAQIVGIKIYDVVSSLAGVGLSFIVFRAIRRAYL
jgi:hypothetical protein